MNYYLFFSMCRVASIQLVHRNRHWAGRVLVAWREYSFRCRLQRVAFVDRLAHISRRWRLLSCFRALSRHIALQKLSNALLQSRSHRQTRSIFISWKKQHGQHCKLVRGKAALFKYFVVGSLRFAIYLWRVKVKQARRIDRSISMRQALQNWKLQYRATVHGNRSLLRVTVHAWSEWLHTRKLSNRHYLNRTKASLSLAKR